MKQSLVRRGLIALLVSIALVAVVLSGCSEEKQAAPSAPEVQVVEVIQKDMPITKEWVGQTTGAEDVEIRARVNGWLTSINFREGTEVRKGALLYTIDDSELRQQVAEAQGEAGTGSHHAHAGELGRESVPPPCGSRGREPAGSGDRTGGGWVAAR